MENKVLLIDENNVKVGKTFRRRAAQLVSQQRADWTDDSRSGIRFKAGPESMDEAMNEAVKEAIALDLYEEPETSEPDDRFYTLARKRLRERKLFVRHSAAFIPGILIIDRIAQSLGYFTWGKDYIVFFSGILCGAWAMLYAIHLWRYVRTRRKIRANRESRYARRLETEVYRLKNMCFSEKI